MHEIRGHHTKIGHGAKRTKRVKTTQIHTQIHAGNRRQSANTNSHRGTYVQRRRNAGHAVVHTHGET